MRTPAARAARTGEAHLGEHHAAAVVEQQVQSAGGAGQHRAGRRHRLGGHPEQPGGGGSHRAADRDQPDRVGVQLPLPVQGLEHPLERLVGADHHGPAPAPVGEHPVQLGRALGQRDLHVGAAAQHVLGDPHRFAVGLPGRRIEQHQQRPGALGVRRGAGYGRGQRRHDRSFLR
ncbi:hypothetical protein [Kitasatospora fiedleri]|uniref:hypothetical protein n=1 Tax=Kitasatospora fiedleri TaxID=2991545 RepID=UPI002499C52A|nr:hypothetical protein [Kitasatospora fiedleri]